MALNTLTDITAQIKRNLDDADDTSFGDAKILILINEAINWLVVEAENYDYIFRRKSEDHGAVVGTVAYNLAADVRRVYKIERIEGTDIRREGTLIRSQQVNNFNYRWAEPICFIDHDGTNMRINFATLGAPKDAFTLRVHYVPQTTALVSGSDSIVDFEEQFIPLLIMRATFQAYGGESGADQFWSAQYKAALVSAAEQWENRHEQYIHQVDDGYY